MYPKLDASFHLSYNKKRVEDVSAENLEIPQNFA